MNIQNENQNVQITMDAIRQLDVNGNVVGNTGSIKYSLQTFANQDFTFIAEEEESSLYDFNSTSNETLLEQTAKGLRTCR